MAGALAIANIHAEAKGISAAEVCMRVLKDSEGAKFIALTMYLPQDKVLEGVSTKFIMEDPSGNGIGKLIFEDFLPEALAQDRYAVAPEPLVLGKGLESVQAGFDAQRKGVSARKIVVSL